jgi:hypothetical protein
VLAAVVAASLAAAEKKPSANAVLAGTVFDSNGRALPGCVVEIVSEAAPSKNIAARPTSAASTPSECWPAVSSSLSAGKASSHSRKQ